MKKVLFPLLGLVLALGLALPTATPAVAAGSMTVVSDNNTMVTAGNVPSATYPHNAVYAWEPVPLYPNDGPDDSGWEQNSLWDKNLTGHVFSAGADWIWESYRVVNPVAGDVVDFQKTFYIPGVPSSGTLHITCDNGYEAWVNGNGTAAPGGMSAQLGAGWRMSNLTESFVNSQNWQSVESWDISGYLQAGWNTLDIYTANEEMSNGTISSNPAGLIFEIDITYEVPDIDKTLVDSDPDLTPDTNGNDVDEVEIATVVTFTMEITVTNDTGVDLTDVLVHDRLGGELHLDSTVSPPGTVVTTWTRGKTEKWFIDWTIASLPDGGSETLTIVASLDKNPGGHQEYSSPGVYDLNSGATIVSAVIDEVVVKFDIQTDPIQVEVLPTD